MRLRRGAAVLAVGAATLLAAGCGTAPRPSVSLHPTTGAGASSAVLSACRLLTNAQAAVAIGTADPDRMSPPTVVQPGSCSWHSEPNCSLRSLSIELHSGDAAVHTFEADRLRVADGDLAPGVGQAAFFSADDLPPGAAVLIQHLDVRQGATWLRFTMLGRISLTTGQMLLRSVAEASLAALPRSASVAAGS